MKDENYAGEENTLKNTLKDFDEFEVSRKDFKDKVEESYDLGRGWLKKREEGLEYISNQELDPCETFNLALVYSFKGSNVLRSKRKLLGSFYSDDPDSIKDIASDLNMVSESRLMDHPDNHEILIFADERERENYEEKSEKRIQTLRDLGDRELTDKDVTLRERQVIANTEADYHEFLASMKGAPEKDAKAMAEWVRKNHMNPSEEYIAHHFFSDLVENGFEEGYNILFALRGASENYDSFFGWHPYSPNSEKAKKYCATVFEVIKLYDNLLDDPEYKILSKVIDDNFKADLNRVNSISDLRRGRK